MPLSEQEQKLLDEMERGLYHNDADFVSAIGSRRGKVNYGSLVFGILLALLGLVVVIIGVTIRQPLVGILGFVIMFIAVLVALRQGKSAPGAASGQGTKAHGSGASATRGSFMDRLNDRWDNRGNRRE